MSTPTLYKTCVYREMSCVGCDCVDWIYPSGDEPLCFKCSGYRIVSLDKDAEDDDKLVCSYITNWESQCGNCSKELTVAYVEDTQYTYCSCCNIGREKYMAALAEWV